MNDVKAQAEFTEFVLREMPSGTVISDPAWWAPRLWRAAVHAMTRDAAPVKESLTTDDERARFEAWYREEHGHDPVWMSGLYFDAIVATLWRGWQARAKIPADHLGGANKMVAALSALTDWHEWSFEQSERAAGEFYRETGMLAPFKDASAASYVSAEHSAERRQAWTIWYATRNATLIDAARTALASARGEG